MNAQQNLEVGLSYNFEVRDHPLFHLINAKVQKDQGNITEAEKTLKRALDLAKKETDNESKSKKPGSAGSKKVAFSSADMATIYLELSDCYRIQNKSQESTRFDLSPISLITSLIDMGGIIVGAMGAIAPTVTERSLLMHIICTHSSKEV